jgi:hypothetical protein
MTNHQVAMMRFTSIIILVSLIFAGRITPAMAGGMERREEILLSSAANTRSVQETLLADPSAEQEKEKSPSPNAGRLSPGRVALISAALPGFGQIYNGSAWKLPIYYGLLGYFGYSAVHSNNKYAEFRDKYNADPASPNAESLRTERNKYQERRNMQIVWLCVSYVAGILDAYVDAHLYGFDKITNENLGTSAPMDTMSPALAFQFKF